MAKAPDHEPTSRVLWKSLIIQHGRSPSIESSNRTRRQQAYSSYGHILINTQQDIWFELLQYTNSLDDQWIQELTKDELNFNKAVAILCSFGLVNPDRALQQWLRSRGYSMHSCVHL